MLVYVRTYVGSWVCNGMYVCRCTCVRTYRSACICILKTHALTIITSVSIYTHKPMYLFILILRLVHNFLIGREHGV